MITQLKKLSEWFMQCLFQAYRSSNVPAGGQASLQRFLRQFVNRARKDSDN